jgi:hypothetical protein
MLRPARGLSSGVLVNELAPVWMYCRAFSHFVHDAVA